MLDKPDAPPASWAYPDAAHRLIVTSRYAATVGYTITSAASGQAITLSPGEMHELIIRIKAGEFDGEWLPEPWRVTDERVAGHKSRLDGQWQLSLSDEPRHPVRILKRESRGHTVRRRAG